MTTKLLPARKVCKHNKIQITKNTNTNTKTQKKKIIKEEKSLTKKIKLTKTTTY